MKLVTPEVYHVANTEMSNCQAYFDSIGASEYQADQSTDAQTNLAMIGGKLCYRSFKPGLNVNVTRVREDCEGYIANIHNVGHGSVIEHGSVTFIFKNVSRVFCYRQDTEVLTQQGWKFINTLKDTDILLTQNPDTLLSEWEKPKKLHSFDYVGELYSWENSNFKSPWVTPDHLMWAKKYDVRVTPSFQKISAEEMQKLNRFYGDYEIRTTTKKNSSITIGGISYPSKTFFRWLGFVVTDGTLNKDLSRVAVNQKVCADKVKELMESLFKDRYSISGDTAYKTFYINDKPLCRWIFRFFKGRLKTERSLLPMLQRSLEERECFLEGVFLGDGSSHERAAGVVYACSERLAKEYQVLYASVGVSSNVRVDTSRVGQSHVIGGATIINNFPSYMVSLHKRDRFIFKKSDVKKTMHYGKVYCPQTNNGLIYVRREGRSFWCGNTHELARHRIGTAISQESLRFVRLQDLSIWIPPIFKEYPEADEIFHETVEYLENVQKRLAEIFELDNQKSFATKKFMTSHMRRLAPIGLSTSMMWSANMRTLRHVIQARTSRHAEEEIRLVFGNVAHICVKLFPIMMGDFVAERVDGYDEWTTPHAAMPYDQEKLINLRKQVESQRQEIEHLQKFK